MLKKNCGSQYLNCADVEDLDSLLKLKESISKKVIFLSANNRPDSAIQLLISANDSSLVNSFFNKYNSFFKSQQDQLLILQNLHQQQIVDANRVLIFIAILTICFFGFSMWWLLQQITQKDNLLEENKSYIDIINNNTDAIKQLQEQEHLLAESLKQSNELLEGQVNNQTQLITDVFERIKQVHLGTDSQLNIVYVNGKLEDVFGIDAKDLIGKPINQFLFKLAGESLTNLLKEGRPIIGKSNLEFVHPQNGKWYDASIYYADNGVSMIIRNINKNKLDELELVKSRQMYQFISKANEVILHAKNEEELYSQICELSVSYQNILFTWIGIPDDVSKVVKPFIWAGQEAGYLTAIKSITISEEATGNGPCGMAFRTGIYYYSNDIEHDPAMDSLEKRSIT